MDETTAQKANRKKINLTLSPDNHKFLKENTENASRFVDNLVSSVKSGFSPGYFAVIPKSEWTERELNPRPLPCQGSDLPLIYRPAENCLSPIRLYVIS